jgi:hypothetical protein
MLGVTHVAVVKWEKEQAKMSLVQDVYLRMLFMGMLKDREINSIFKEIRPELLAEAKESKKPLAVNTAELLKAAV